MQQEDPADAAYLIIDGHTEVILETPSGPVIVASVGASEIAVRWGSWETPHAWTVRAKDRVIALRIPKEPFMRIVRSSRSLRSR